MLQLGLDSLTRLQRHPEPHNGRARELFASDLLAARSGELALGFEEREKVLLRISETLDLIWSTRNPLPFIDLLLAGLEGGLRSPKALFAPALGKTCNPQAALGRRESYRSRVEVIRMPR